LRFGTFAPLRRAPGETDDAQYFGRGRAEVLYAETLGYDDVWCAEAYFLDVLGISSLQQVTWLAGFTSRIRLGTAIVSMPLHNPLEVAITAANVDHMSNGRLDLAFGRGFSALLVPDLASNPKWSDGFIGLGNPKSRPPEFPKDGLQAKYLESISCVKGLIENAEFSFHGDFYDYEGVWLYPRPRQRSMPLWAVAQSLSSYKAMGERGFNLLIPLPGYHGNFQTWEGTKDALAGYREAWSKAGNPGEPQVILRTQVCLDRDRDRAFEIAYEAYSTLSTDSVFADSALRRTIGGEPSQLALGFLGGQSNPNVQALMTMPVEEVIEQTTITGTPEFAVEQIRRIRDEFGVVGIIVESISILNGKRPDYWQTLQLFADQVMPHFASVKRRRPQAASPQAAFSQT
jgi:alkanesulfonate monooxygenase SsuD/methylene tetrahydromethanopterin reductase-like flavin-dependent oxidoreductase (luciferase family)